MSSYAVELHVTSKIRAYVDIPFDLLADNSEIRDYILTDVEDRCEVVFDDMVQDMTVDLVEVVKVEWQ